MEEDYVFPEFSEYAKRPPSPPFNIGDALAKIRTEARPVNPQELLDFENEPPAPCFVSQKKTAVPGIYSKLKTCTNCMFTKFRGIPVEKSSEPQLFYSNRVKKVVHKHTI
jgi:hypothetical protein